MLNFEEDKLIAELKEKSPKRVLVQLPEGVKGKAPEISKLIEGLGIEVVFSGETAWGGCCVSVEEAKKAECDLIVHFGHVKFMDVGFPVLYIVIKDELELNPLLEKSLEKLKDFETIGLSYSIQHRHDIDKIVKFYEAADKRIILSAKKGYSAHEGHVVGCEFNGLKTIENDVGAFIIIGNNFHSMGACLMVEKPVFLLDVYNDDIVEMGDVRNKIIRQRAMSIEKFKDSKVIGILQEMKAGQNFGMAKVAKKKIEEAGKVGIIITLSEFTPDKLTNFNTIKAFVSLACPRIAMDDFAKYGKPILTYKEMLVAVGEKKWEDLLESGFW
jgi:2-(3-amino-3-carboxypropyl)histidine synthase